MDLELKKAFEELQKKMYDTQTQMRISDVQISQLQQTKKKAELTSQEINSLPGDTKTYQSVGRMFVLQDREFILNELKDAQKQSENRVKELEAKKVYLEKNVKESEANLREMVTQRRK